MHHILMGGLSPSAVAGSTLDYRGQASGSGSGTTWNHSINLGAGGTCIFVVTGNAGANHAACTALTVAGNAATLVVATPRDFTTDSAPAAIFIKTGCPSGVQTITATFNGNMGDTNCAAYLATGLASTTADATHVGTSAGSPIQPNLSCVAGGVGVVGIRTNLAVTFTGGGGLSVDLNTSGRLFGHNDSFAGSTWGASIARSGGTENHGVWATFH